MHPTEAAQASTVTSTDEPSSDAKPVQAPQFGGATPDESLAAAVKLQGEPGYVSSKPMLSTGSWGAEVAELADLLAKAGYPNHVAAGLAAPMLSDELMRSVRAFQDANQVDPTSAQDGAAPLIRKDHEGIVDAATWAALYKSAGQDQAGLAIRERYPMAAA